MSDIIKDAKKALEGATPGPWKISGEFDPEYPELQGAPQLENGLLKVPIISHDIYGDFFPEDGDLIAKSWTNAKALAEETWEYAVQVKCTASKEWRLLSFKLPFITHKTTWFRSQSEAEHERQEQVSEQVNSRIVRRRVSPPEVISE